MQKNIVILLSMVITCSCFTSRSVAKTGIEEISFGYGGGFTGKVTTYYLKKDGSLFQGDALLKKIAMKEVANIFSKATAFVDYSYNKPSNLYNFLEIRHNKNNNKIVWSTINRDVDSSIVLIYNKLIKEIAK